ncbi:hypothetical protein [Enterobacter cloacae]|nr:hypothetical protein [Enterobacter cloacae]
MKIFIAITMIVLMLGLLVTPESKLLIISQILEQLVMLSALFIHK